MHHARVGPVMSYSEVKRSKMIMFYVNYASVKKKKFKINHTEEMNILVWEYKK